MNNDLQNTDFIRPNAHLAKCFLAKLSYAKLPYAKQIIISSRAFLFSHFLILLVVIMVRKMTKHSNNLLDITVGTFPVECAHSPAYNCQIVKQKQTTSDRKDCILEQEVACSGENRAKSTYNSDGHTAYQANPSPVATNNTGCIISKTRCGVSPSHTVPAVMVVSKRQSAQAAWLFMFSLD